MEVFPTDGGTSGGTGEASEIPRHSYEVGLSTTSLRPTNPPTLAHPPSNTSISMKRVGGGGVYGTGVVRGGPK